MSEVLAAILGALAVIGIPLVGWFSQRATREGRLLLRVNRLGSAYILMPASPEKETFEAHLNGAVADLNSWLDPDNAKRRKLIRRINGWTYAVGVVAVLVALPSLGTQQSPWAASWVGASIGLAISLFTLGAAFLIERGARLKSAAASRARDEAETAARMEALRRGETPKT